MQCICNVFHDINGAQVTLQKRDFLAWNQTKWPRHLRLDRSVVEQCGKNHFAFGLGNAGNWQRANFSPCDLSACVAQCGPGSGESFKSRSEKWSCLENFMPQTWSWTKSAHQCENQVAACQIHVPNSLADSYSLGPLEGQKWREKNIIPDSHVWLAPRNLGNSENIN